MEADMDIPEVGTAPPVVVGMGGSAGALEAYEAILRATPETTVAAFVIVQHLDPKHESLLPELLQRMTSLPVARAHEGDALVAGHVYVGEPGAMLTLDGNTFRVVRAASKDDRFHPIDAFFESLAKLGQRAIAVVLSGNGSDGAMGIQRVRQSGGLVVAQDPQTARFDGMPRSAIATGVVDHVIAPDELPRTLLRKLRRESSRDATGAQTISSIRAMLPRICEAIRKHTGHDFSTYKTSTLLRRVDKSLGASRFPSLAEYVAALEHDAREATTLQKSLLIGVTRFFRDPETFEHVSQQVVPLLCRERDAGTPIRVWVPACSTGEEAYSLAMIFQEFADRHGSCPPLTLFATDVDPVAIEVAREGRYPSNIEQQVSPARLRRFFVRAGRDYRVSGELRAICTFSVHNLLNDPPFSKLNFISCRNLFIYFEVVSQARLIPIFHYALSPEGFLLLGPAEGVPSGLDLFRVIDKRHRVYQRREGVKRPPLSFGKTSPSRPALRSPTAPVPRPMPERELAKDITAELLRSFAPPALVIDERGEILFYSGKMARFLDPPTGTPTNNAFDLIVRSVRPQAHALVHRVIKSKTEAVHPNLTLQSADGMVTHVDLVVRPLPSIGDAQLLLLVFQEREPIQLPDDAIRTGVSVHSSDSVVQQLEGELRETRDHLQSTIEDVKSSNEELLAMNEELQSANEELQTSKEEFQSLNEELETVNAELSRKVDELDRVNSDLQNFFENTRVPVVFLDTELRIKKFTPAADQLFRLMPADIGRPFTDLASSLATADLDNDFRQVLRSLTAIERELTTVDGTNRSYLMRANPYRTVNSVISGVVVAFSDVTELKRTQQRAAALAAIVESSTDAIISASLDGVIISWNTGAEALFWHTARDRVGRPVVDLIPRDKRGEFAQVDADVRQGKSVRSLETEWLRKDGRCVEVSMTVSPVRTASGTLTGLSFILRDITEQRRAAIERARLAAIVESSDDAIVGKDLTGIVTSWNSGAERLFGYSAEEMVGSPIYRIIPAEHPEDVPRILETVRRGERVRHYETVRVHKTGRRIHVSLSVSPVRDAQGKIVGASKIARDITDRVELEQTLKRNLQLRDEFISVASHELRTPLTSMKIQSDAIKRAFDKADSSAFSRERVLKLVNQTDRQLNRLNRLVEDMLDITRLGTKGLALTLEDVDLSALTQQTSAALRPFVESNGSTLSEDIAAGIVGRWDRLQLEQIITNLLTNATRYGNAKPISLRLSSDGKWATLEVTDQGVGIAPQDQERIFERFERVPTRGVTGGFGIGLFIVREAVKAHDGVVRVQSALGNGATFVVALPLRGPADR